MFLFTLDFKKNFTAKQVARALACAILFAVTLLISPRILSAVFPEKSIYEKAHEALTPQIQFAFIGSSHVFCGIDPEQMSLPAMNIAAPVFRYTFLKEIYDANAARLPNLKAVAIELDATLLLADTADLMPRFYEVLSEYGVNTHYGVSDFFSQNKKFVNYVFAPIFKFRLVPQEVIGRQNKVVKAGFVPETGEKIADDTNEHIEARDRLEGPQKSRLFKENLKALGELTQTLIEKNIPVVMTQFPMRSDLARMRPESWDKIEEVTWNTLYAKFANRGLHRFSFSENCGAFVDAEFRDLEHFNNVGIQRATKCFDSYLATLVK